LAGKFDIRPIDPRKLEITSKTIGNLYQGKLKPRRPFRLKERTLLTASTQFPNHELSSPIRSLAPDARPLGKIGYLIRSSRRMLDRLTAAAIEFVLIAILVAGFIVAALLALDLSDVLKW
jgi:Flp pilus assembly pilin Flp